MHGVYHRRLLVMHLLLQPYSLSWIRHTRRLASLISSGFEVQRLARERSMTTHQLLR